MNYGRTSRSIVARLAMLASANLAAIAAIAAISPEGGSLGAVLAGLANNLASTLIAGIGMTAVIMTGSIDLSIGPIVATAGVVFGVMVYFSWPPLVCFAACVGVAWIMQMINGLVIRWLRLPSIIVTLAALAFYRGVALVIADTAIRDFSGNISVADDAYHGPGKRYAAWLLAVAGGTWLLWAHFAKRPRLWLALGGNEEACRLEGLQPESIRLSAFCASGWMLGLAALIQATQIQSIDPARLGDGFELKVIGAVVLGGTNIFGGEGAFIGTILGGALLYLIDQLLVFAGTSVYLRDVLVGAVVLGVIGADCLWHRRRKRLEELA